MTTARQITDPLNLLGAVDGNLRVAMRFFGQATGSGDIRRLDRAEAVYSGLDYGVFNIAFLTQPLGAPQDLAQVLQQCGRYYSQYRVRWSFWLCDDLLDPVLRRRSRDLFTAAGMRQISQAPGMVTSSLSVPWRVLPSLDCRPVDNKSTRFAFAELTSVCFDIPLSVARAVYEPERAWMGDYRGFVGYSGARPVSMLALVRAERALGIYSLGTLPEYRRRGYGEAMLRTALAERREAEPMVLESTEAGYPLYRRLGFREMARFTVYLTK
ncbi:MAG: GNAT family N-acetyltransferase [Bryobacterales bacterium]|nr:GNAT family N-acetyltransferase [Bryobacterales bacterium]MBV9399989.1 GNAT family N-acetyltransferase [Bryobacterales bacterium]